MRKKTGFVQIPLVIVLMVMAVAIPVTSKLIKNSQDSRSKATDIILPVEPDNGLLQEFFGCKNDWDNVGGPGNDAAKTCISVGFFVTREECQKKTLTDCWPNKDFCIKTCSPGSTLPEDPQLPVEPCLIPECPALLVPTCPEGVDCTKQCDRYICLPKAEIPNPPGEPAPPIGLPPIGGPPVNYFICKNNICQSVGVFQSPEICLSTIRENCLTSDDCLTSCGVGDTTPKPVVSCGIKDGKERFPGETWCKVGSPKMVKKCLNDFTVSISEFECGIGGNCVDGKCEHVSDGCMANTYGGLVFSIGQKLCQGKNSYIECQVDKKFSDIKFCGENQICVRGNNGYDCVNKDTACVDYDKSNQYFTMYYLPGDVTCKSDNSFVRCLDNVGFGPVQQCDEGSLCYPGKGCIRNGGCLRVGKLTASDGETDCDENNLNIVKTCLNSKWLISDCSAGEKCDTRTGQNSICVKTVDKCTHNGIDYKIGEKRCSDDGKGVVECLEVGWDNGKGCDIGMRCSSGGVCQNACSVCPEGKLTKDKGNANCDEIIDLNDFSKWLSEYTSNVDISEWQADFKCKTKQSKPDLTDFGMWLSSFAK